MSPEHGATAEQLMKNANFALSQAKKQGKGAYQLFHPNFSIRMDEILHIEDSLRQTLARQKQELVFHETTGQLSALVRYCCDEVQGYYFARPMSARNVCNLLRKGNENINRFCETLAMGSSFL